MCTRYFQAKSGRPVYILCKNAFYWLEQLVVSQYQGTQFHIWPIDGFRLFAPIFHLYILQFLPRLRRRVQVQCSQSMFTIFVYGSGPKQNVNSAIRMRPPPARIYKGRRERATENFRYFYDVGLKIHVIFSKLS